MYLNNNKNPNYWVLDIEANGLTPDTIWCVVVRNCSTGEVLDFLNKETFLGWLEERSSDCERDVSSEHPAKSINSEHQSSFFFVGHNILSYDIPWLNKLWGTNISYDQCIDTLVLSLLYNPALEGGHSLESWGNRLRFPKQEYSDWSKFTKEMLVYCRNDCELTYKVFVALTDKMRKMGYSEKSCEIEHKIRVIINEQQEHGFWFDKERAKSLRDELRERQSYLTKQIQELFPPTLTLVNECSFRRNKDGSLPLRIEKAISRYHSVVVDEETGIYKCYSLIEFNIGSPKQRVERLLELGWEPEKFTAKGFPQVDEDALVRFQEGLQELKDERAEVVGAIAEWLVLQGRSSMIETWLNNLGPDSKIHGRVNSCGATTRRMLHSKPNCVPLYSQALTRNGWKFWYELVVGEDILAYDLETRTKKWTPLLAVSSFDEAEIYSFGQQHPRKRLYCTKNHSWVVRGRDSKKDGSEKLVEANRLKHNRPIRINAPFDNDVSISDFFLIQKKYNHDWISEICKLSDPELHAIMQGFLLADGCRHGKDKYWTFAQAEGHLLDAFLTCFYLISHTRVSACQKRKLKGPNQRMGYNVAQTGNTWMRTKDMSLKYEGVEPVWCPTTALGTWVMKQGDFITITGNSANIPSGAKAKYGHECRALWGVEPDKGLILVGADASGLENVGLLHYLNNKEAEKLLAQKKPNDVHTLNSRRLTEALGRDIDREWGSKTSFYAALYGAYPPKLASIVKGTKDEGQIVQDIILGSIPGLPNLIKEIQYEWKSNRGRLVTIDGGYVQCPSASASLNYKIQSLGACVMKLAAILLYEEADKQNLWFKFVGNIHDEFQMETLESNGNRLGKLACWSMGEAARQLRFNLPLSGEYKLGYSWNETH